MTPFVEHVIGPARQALWALLGAVVVLLLIACVNVSGLMLTRASHARREHAIQLAMGASNRALTRQWLAEAGVLAALGGAAGIALASGLTRAMLALAPAGIPRLTDAALNLPVALVALAATVVAAVVCGAGPLRLARGTQLLEALHQTARSTAAVRPMRMRSALVVVQVAMAVVLLVTAGLVARSFQSLRALDLGFVPDQVLSLQLDPRLEPARANAWMRQLIDGLAAHPDVEAIGAVYLRPLALGPIGQGTTVVLEGQPDTPRAGVGQSAAQLSGGDAWLLRRHADSAARRPHSSPTTTATAANAWWSSGSRRRGGSGRIGRPWASVC